MGKIEVIRPRSPSTRKHKLSNINPQNKNPKKAKITFSKEMIKNNSKHKNIIERSKRDCSSSFSLW